MYRCPNCKSSNIYIVTETKTTANQRSDGSLVVIGTETMAVENIGCNACGTQWDDLSIEDWLDGK
jgi:predicted Zn-ribbon and HTH transcriptional regulator